jgi:DNA-binding NarL/FixJ family response regulator
MVLQITPWERTALQLLADGVAPDELADHSPISAYEVDAALAALVAKMGAANRREAIVAAIRRGLLLGPARDVPVSNGASHPSSR